MVLRNGSYSFLTFPVCDLSILFVLPAAAFSFVVNLLFLWGYLAFDLLLPWLSHCSFGDTLMVISICFGYWEWSKSIPFMNALAFPMELIEFICLYLNLKMPSDVNRTRCLLHASNLHVYMIASEFWASLVTIAWSSFLANRYVPTCSLHFNNICICVTLHKVSWLKQTYLWIHLFFMSWTGHKRRSSIH